jgi:hypothetical protein
MTDTGPFRFRLIGHTHQGQQADGIKGTGA